MPSFFYSNSLLLSFLLLILLTKSGSSLTGRIFSISSKSKLSSDGAWSDPAELNELASLNTSAVYLNTISKPFLKCLLYISLLLYLTFSILSK